MLCSCATTILESSATGGSGVAYFLPKALLPVQLADVNGNLVLTVDKPQFVADLDYRYTLSYVPDAAASDTIEITVDPATSLLQTASSTADDKTGDLIVAIARSAATLAQLIAQSGEAPKTVLFDELIDPTKNLDGVVRRMNAVAVKYGADTYTRLNCGTKPADGDKERCEGYRSWRTGAPIAFTACRATGQECSVKVAVAADAPGAAASPPAPKPAVIVPADCNLGVCYRPAQPYRIEFALNTQYQYSTVVSLPNDGPVMMWPFGRTAFVKRINNAEFQNGMLKKVHVEKPSEAVEVAMLPVNVVKAVFESITGVFKFRVDLTNGEKNLVDAQKQLLDSQNALQKAMTPQSAQQANVLLSGSTNGRAVAGGLGAITPPAQAGAFPGGSVSPSNPGTGTAAGQGAGAAK